MLKSEWVVAVAEIGNTRARHFWENRLAESQRPGVDSTPSVWVAFLKQKYIQHLWIPSRSKTRTEDSKKQSDVMEDLLDIDFSGYGPDAVMMDEGWSTEIPTTTSTRRPVPDRFGGALSAAPAHGGGSGFSQPPQNGFGPSGFSHLPTSPSTFIPSSTPSALPGGYGNGGFGGSIMNPIPAEGMSLFGNQPISMDYTPGPFNLSYPVYSCMPQPSRPQLSMAQSSMLQPSMPQPSMAQPSMTQPSMPQPSIQPSMAQPSMPQPSINQNSPHGQANFSVEYMFSQPSTQTEQHNDNFLYMPSQYQQAPLIPSYRPSPVPRSPHLTAAHPSQQPSMIGQHVGDPNGPVMRQDSSKTTIVPLATPAREPPREQPRHQRGLSSVVRNAGLIEDEAEDEDDEDEEDYESRIEKTERKTDDTVKRKVMTALQSALSDLQLTGIQIRWAEIEVDQRIGVGGFAIVYHGMYR